MADQKSKVIYALAFAAYPLHANQREGHEPGIFGLNRNPAQRVKAPLQNAPIKLRQKSSDG
jgi:hypothetical protein